MRGRIGFFKDFNFEQLDWFLCFWLCGEVD